MFSEDKQIINTKRYAAFQQICSEAGLFAVREAKEHGLPITYVENDRIIKEYIDGRKEVLGTVKPRISVEKSVYVFPDTK